MQILPPKWATRDSNSTLEMAPRTPTVCKGLRSSSNLKRKDAPLTLIISFIEKEKKFNILRYKSPTPAPLPSYLSQVAIKFSQWCLKKTRRFEVCKNLNQYVKKNELRKSTEQNKNCADFLRWLFYMCLMLWTYFANEPSREFEKKRNFVKTECLYTRVAPSFL